MHGFHRRAAPFTYSHVNNPHTHHNVFTTTALHWHGPLLSLWTVAWLPSRSHQLAVSVTPSARSLPHRLSHASLPAHHLTFARTSLTFGASHTRPPHLTGQRHPQTCSQPSTALSHVRSSLQGWRLAASRKAVPVTQAVDGQPQCAYEAAGGTAMQPSLAPINRPSIKADLQLHTYAQACGEVSLERHEPALKVCKLRFLTVAVRHAVEHPRVVLQLLQCAARDMVPCTHLTGHMQT